MIGYCDGDKEIGVSTLGYLMSLGSCVVSWRSCKHFVPTNSMKEEEYVATVKVKKEIVWVKKILEDF